MKIAVASSGRNLEAPVDSRFGRAAGFIIYDTDSDEYTVADNKQNLNAAQGAGIQTAQNVAAAGAGVVLAANFGPKAFTVLQSAGIKMFLCSVSTVMEVIEDFRNGRLAEASSASVAGHWL